MKKLPGGDAQVNPKLHKWLESINAISSLYGQTTPLRVAAAVNNSDHREADDLPAITVPQTSEGNKSDCRFQ